MTGPRPDVHLVVTARALAHPARGGTWSVGFASRHLPRERHPSYAALTCCRFGILTLWIHGYLQATHNFSERMLRLEKLIESSSMFRVTLEGRFALDIMRTVLQTAVAARAPLQQYMLDVLRTPHADIEADPGSFTPHAWAAANSSPSAEA
jgi:hypothetical protein